ncbi:virulence factor family protein [Tianweitania sp. BSSL-BM11]|uniref:Virulence factor family protein n=1 Tax=Tianweitania aestuarii TaxID=2814886 RepID=A0ABS5RUM3_9HYPH|nr:AcvB/VirJ family lysyl-phosphatidylglycerol hydrolase [Tianweitania aestuarii]MBS9720652.1 virulence factor family protein [Tianweitania aestuarii]
MKSVATLVFALLCGCSGSAFAQTTPLPAPVAKLTASRLEEIPVYRPAGRVKAIVVYISDKSGWSEKDDEAVQALLGNDDAVLAVDFAHYAANLDADDGECLYVVGEITDLAQAAQRQLNLQTYRQPVIVGTGEGATFAYAAIADSPVNTLGGAVGSGFANRLNLRLPFCPGASSKRLEDGGFSYGFDSTLPNDAHLFVADADVAQIESDAEAQDRITVSALDDDPIEQIVEAVSELSGAAHPFGDLPAVDLPSDDTPKALAILVSGDGGWRDLDKTIGDYLSTQSIHVVGLDSLHYFWAKKNPNELSRDLAAIINEADPTHDLPIMLIGYSFGADTIPFAYPLLPQDIQDRTKVLALMAPGQHTSFQVTVSGWLGIDDSGYDIVPAIAKLPADRVICLYGEEEDDAACPDPALKAVTVVKTEGGHHFDGNYEAIAQRFLARLKP